MKCNQDFFSKQISQNLNPVWTSKHDPTCHFQVEKHMEDYLIIEVWDKDIIGSDPLGYCQVALSKLKRGNYELPLEQMGKQKIHCTGTLYFHVQTNFCF